MLEGDARDFLTLHLVPGLGPRLTTALLDRFGSAAAILRATPSELREVAHIGPKLAADLHAAMQRLNVDSEVELLNRFGCQVLTVRSPDYPPPLAELSDAPPLLYMRGQWQARDAKAMAIVGSRRSTSYGVRIAERLAAGLVQAGYTVVSGLARGIDAAAHRGALKAKGRTLAVLAGGLSRIYPPEHADLAREIEAAGALFSEAPMNMEPLAQLFPMRNRIISGLSRGVVIVEAADRSGALITASRAAEHGRPVFAVPGPVDHVSSSGANALIRKGAILTRGVDDVLEELEGVKTGPPAQRAEDLPELSEPERRIWDALESAPRHIDEVARELGCAVHELTGRLMMLEMKKVVRRLPGNMYERR